MVWLSEGENFRCNFRLLRAKKNLEFDCTLTCNGCYHGNRFHANTSQVKWHFTAQKSSKSVEAFVLQTPSTAVSSMRGCYRQYSYACLLTYTATRRLSRYRPSAILSLKKIIFGHVTVIEFQICWCQRNVINISSRVRPPDRGVDHRGPRGPGPPNNLLRGAIHYRPPNNLIKSLGSANYTGL